VAVDGVVYYRVFDPVISVINVSNAQYSTRLLAQTTLRTVLGTKNLSEILSDRENISQFMQVSRLYSIHVPQFSASLSNAKGVDFNDL